MTRHLLRCPFSPRPKRGRPRLPSLAERAGAREGFTLAEAAYKFGVPVETLRKAAREKRLGYIPFGPKTKRVTEEDLARFKRGEPPLRRRQ